MSLGKSDPPPSPDYAAAARAQGGANLQSTIASNVMNRPNEITPYGSRIWSQSGQYQIPAAEGNPAVSVPLWQSKINLTPAGQDRVAQEQRITGTLGDVAEQGLNRVGAAVAQPFDMQNLPQVANIPGMAPQQGGGGDQSLAMRIAGALRGAIPGAGQPVQTGGAPNALGTAGTGDRAAYDLAMSQWADASDRGTKHLLANPSMPLPQDFGLTSTTQEPAPRQPEPWGGGMGVGLPGVPPLPQQGAMQPLPQQTAQPGITQVPEQGQVGDALYRQATRYMDPQYEQQGASLENKLVNQGLQRGTEAFDTAMRNFGQDRERAYADARDRAILASGQEQSRQFGLGAQQFSQGMAAGDQQFGQGANLFGMGLAGQGQDFGQQAQRFSLGLGAQGQQYGQQAQTYGMSAAERQRALQEQAYMRQLPLNEMNALRTGAQVNMPQFQPYATSNVQPAPIMQGTQLQGQSDINRYNAEQAQGGAFTSGLFSLAGSMGGVKPWWLGA